MRGSLLLWVSSRACTASLRGQQNWYLLDNTNADRDVRSKWIALAAKHSVPIRCVHFLTNVQVCEHNDAVRALNETVRLSSLQWVILLIHEKAPCHAVFPKPWISNPIQMNPEKRKILPKLAFTSFSSRYQRPELIEGFQDVIEVPFKVRLTAYPFFPVFLMLRS